MNRSDPLIPEGLDSSLIGSLKSCKFVTILKISWFLGLSLDCLSLFRTPLPGSLSILCLMPELLVLRQSHSPISLVPYSNVIPRVRGKPVACPGTYSPAGDFNPGNHSRSDEKLRAGHRFTFTLRSPLTEILLFIRSSTLNR